MSLIIVLRHLNGGAWHSVTVHCRRSEGRPLYSCSHIQGFRVLRRGCTMRGSHGSTV